MNALHMANSAYGSTATKAPRAAEYDAFARVTHALRSANQGEPRSYARLAEALHHNRRLWTVLATDVADEGNALPQQLRARLFYLAQFTFEHSRKVLKGEGEAGVLVEINTAVMRGLRGDGETP